MPTRSKIVIVIISFILSITCAFLGAKLRQIIGPYGLGVFIWVGLAPLFIPILGGLSSFVVSLISLSQIERKLFIFSASAITSFLIGYCQELKYM